MITGFQIRAARAGINIKLKELSISTGISLPTLKRMEKIETFEFVQSNPSTIKKLLEFYQACGIEFLEANGVLVKKPQPK